MSYHGTVRQGVVVFDGETPLCDGTRMRVEPEPTAAVAPARGSPGAVLGARVRWAGDPHELDDLLEVRRMRDEDVELQGGQEE